MSVARGSPHHSHRESDSHCAPAPPASGSRRKTPLPTVDAEGVLDISRTFIGTNGLLEVVKLAAADRITEGVPTNTTLCRHLVLSDHQVSSDLLVVILKHLDGATHLESLDLTGNPITHTGGKALASFLRSNPNMLSVKVHNTSVSVAQQKAIAVQLGVNATMTTAERQAIYAKQKKQKEARAEEMKNRSHYRLSVSNVRLLNSLADKNDKSSVVVAASGTTADILTTADGAAAEPVREIAAIRNARSSPNRPQHTPLSALEKVTAVTTTPMATGSLSTSTRPQEEEEPPLQALKLLSNVIGGGYEAEAVSRDHAERQNRQERKYKKIAAGGGDSSSSEGGSSVDE